MSWFTFSQKAAPGEQRRCRQFVWEVLLGSRRARERYANEGMTGVGKFVAVLLGTPGPSCPTAALERGSICLPVDALHQLGVDTGALTAPTPPSWTRESLLSTQAFRAFRERAGPAW